MKELQLGGPDDTKFQLTTNAVLVESPGVPHTATVTHRSAGGLDSLTLDLVISRALDLVISRALDRQIARARARALIPPAGACEIHRFDARPAPEVKPPRPNPRPIRSP